MQLHHTRRILFDADSALVGLGMWGGKVIHFVQAPRPQFAGLLLGDKAVEYLPLLTRTSVAQNGSLEGLGPPGVKCVHMYVMYAWVVCIAYTTAFLP